MSNELDSLGVLRALADESRLRVIAILLHSRERGVEEIAAMLGVRPPTASHHLQRLSNVGLVAMRRDGNAHLYRLDRARLAEISRDLLSPEQLRRLVGRVDGAGWERKVLRDFTEGERLREIPASRKKRLVVLRWLAAEFATGRAYPEAEVNRLLARHHPDFATLRRELVGAGLLTRQAGVYRAP